MEADSDLVGEVASQETVLDCSHCHARIETYWRLWGRSFCAACRSAAEANLAAERAAMVSFRRIALEAMFVALGWAVVFVCIGRLTGTYLGPATWILPFAIGRTIGRRTGGFGTYAHRTLGVALTVLALVAITLLVRGTTTNAALIAWLNRWDDTIWLAVKTSCDGDSDLARTIVALLCIGGCWRALEPRDVPSEGPFSAGAPPPR